MLQFLSQSSLFSADEVFVSWSEHMFCHRARYEVGGSLTSQGIVPTIEVILVNESVLPYIVKRSVAKLQNCEV
uniref:Secreted protein n=1 Tax=Parascaris univalens TaxID=6257 RepID=A0A915AB65_PARUN